MVAMDCFFVCSQDGLVIGNFKFASLMAWKEILFKNTNGYESTK